VPIQLMVGDISTLEVDAIVNAANPSLMAGSGVDGAIHKAAGGELQVACYQFKELSPGVRCPPGVARLTPGFKLKAKWVIHTAGPVWKNGEKGEEETLANCYRNCFAVARQNAVRSIAFPAISCGVYGFPWALGAQIAIREARMELNSSGDKLKVIFCLFSQEIFKEYKSALGPDFREAPAAE